MPSLPSKIVPFFGVNMNRLNITLSSLEKTVKMLREITADLPLTS